MTTPDTEKEHNKEINSTVHWVTYLNIVLYALSYQLQTPVEPYLIKKLSEQAGEGQDINRIYGNLMSFFQTLQMVGSPLVGILLDRIGIRYTSTLVFLASAACYAILSVAHDLPTLFWSKVPTVFQAAFLVAQATAATTTGNDAAARAAALGRMTTAYTIGATLGPTLGGYLADQGDFYIGAKVAVVGSLISVVLSLVYLPNEKKASTTTKTITSGSFWDQLKHQISIAFRTNLWPLLMVKVLGGVVASMHSTAMPLVLTQQLKLEPSQLGMSMSTSMMAVAAFGAVGMAPLTNRLGPARMTYLGLLGRAMLGCLMATVVSVGTGHDHVLIPMVVVAIVHALSSHILATGLTTQTTGAVAAQEQGSLLGLEHSLFSMARIGGPKLSTTLLATGSGGLWPVETVCGICDVLLVLALIATAAQLSAAKPKPNEAGATQTTAPKPKGSLFKKAPIGGLKLAVLFGLMPFCQALDSFPRLLSVTTTRDVATLHSAHWDIRHRGSKRLREIDEEMVQLNVRIYSEDDLTGFDRLQMEGVLSYQPVDEAEDDSQRLLEGISSNYWCYRTVSETYASLDQMQVQYPDLVSVSSIGQSYLKLQDPNEGYDIKVLVIGANVSSVVEKSDIMVVAGHHSRELPPPEVVMRWAQHLLENYGTDPDITWILQRTRIHIVPIANPDGRRIAQENLDWWYRKNGRPNDCGSELYGVDLNRNYPMFYGDDSASGKNPCDTDYRGAGPLSEPESSAVFAYQAALFDDSMKKGTADEAFERSDQACPTNASGIFIDVHSNGDMVYFPWGYMDEPAPNHLSLLTMSAKLAHPGNYELWGPEQDGYLYFVSGDASDATYGIGCVASYGYEIGSEMYASCSELENEIVPIMAESLLYAAKCASAPYLLPLGPDVLSIDVDSTDPFNVILEVQVSDEALIVDHAVFNDSPGQPIAAVHVFVDNHPNDEKSEGIMMNPVDGFFDTETEFASLSLDLSYMEGQHVLYFQATDTGGYAGPVSAIFVELPEAEEVVDTVAATMNATYNISGDNEESLVESASEAYEPGTSSQSTFTVPIASVSSRTYTPEGDETSGQFIEREKVPTQATISAATFSAATTSSTGLLAVAIVGVATLILIRC